jgi:hypothetical protein
MPAPKVGMLFSGDGMSLADVIELGVAAEDAGLDSVWHVEIQREPLVPLTAIAARAQPDPRLARRGESGRALRRPLPLRSRHRAAGLEPPLPRDQL